MDEKTFRHADLIRQVVDNPLFDQAFADIRLKLSNEMLDNGNQTHREALYNEGQLLNRFKNRLIEIANSVRGTERTKLED